MSQRSALKIAWYNGLRVVCRLAAVGVFRLRCLGREHIPQTGGALVVANHQSQLDPIVVGLVFNRRLNYLARKSLFRFAPFRWLIESLDAIPIDREGTGLGGLKETLRRLKQGEMVLIFPEGTRTTDGNVQPFKPGFTTVARRAKVPILPLAIEGPFQSFPRNARLPRPVPLQVEIGPPIPPEEIERLGERELGEEVERRVRQCHQAARRRRDERIHGFGSPARRNRQAAGRDRSPAPPASRASGT
jgi:1-acyl-sn-glycerol-3-phosphate acyltransferase